MAKAERETTCNISDADQEWSIYSASPSMQRRLEKAGATVVKVLDHGGKQYALPKRRVSFRKASPPRVRRPGQGFQKKPPGSLFTPPRPQD